MSKVYKAYAPATISNLGSGFDLLGLALDQPGDYVYAGFGTNGVVIKQIRGHKTGISKTNNSAIVAVQSLLKALNRNANIELTIEKGYAHSSGLGSSAASAVAAVIAVNALLDKPFKQKIDLYPFALAGERFRDQGLPADNVASGLLGGIVLSHPVHRPMILPVPDGLYIAIVRPDINIPTSENRASLPEDHPLPAIIEQTYSISNLILGLYRSDLDLISRGLRDHIIEPHRSSTIPSFNAIKSVAMNAGALGCTISGSGPAIFALAPNSLVAENIVDQWKSIDGLSISNDGLFTSSINQEGAHLC